MLDWRSHGSPCLSTAFFFLLENGYLPVVSSIGVTNEKAPDERINADQAATALAATLWI